MPTPPELLIALQGNADPDAMVLLQMAKVGADLRKPHEPDFAFEVSKHASAEAIAKELCELGYASSSTNPTKRIRSTKS